MKTEVFEILQTEATNRYCIHLYPYGGAWWCCGQSAILLHKHCYNLPCLNKDIDNSGVKHPVMIIDRMTLTSLLKTHSAIEQTETKITIKLYEYHQ